MFRLLQNPGNTIVKCRLEVWIGCIFLVEVQLALTLSQYRLLDQVFQGQFTVLHVGVVTHLIVVIGVVPHVLGNIDELNPLLFRGSIPASEVALIESFDDFIQWIFFVWLSRNSKN